VHEIWSSAPACALHVPRTDGRPVVARPNAAAERWAASLGLAAPDWRALAAQVLEAGARPGRYRLPAADGSAAQGLHCHPVPLADGWLLWLQAVGDADGDGGADAEADAKADATDASAAIATAGAAAVPVPADPLDDRLRMLDRAIELAGVSVWRIDLRARRVDFDGVGFRVAAMSEGTAGIPLEAMRSTIHPDDHDAVLRAADEAVASGRAVDVVARYRNPDGGWRALLTRRVAEFDGSGRALALTGVSLDLDVLARDRARADRTGDRTALVAEALGVGFWSMDAEAGRVEWDQQMYRLYDRDPALGPLAGADWMAEQVHEDDRPWLQARVDRANADWEPRLEAVFRTRPGPRGVRWIQLWTARTEREGRRWMFGMHQDVTERQQAQLALQRERERTRLATVTAGVGIWERGPDGRFTFWNEAMYRLRGLEPDDPRPLAQLVQDSTHPEDAARLEAMLREHMRHGAPYEAEFRSRHADGRWRWFVTRSTLVRDAAGRVIAATGINIDITERKEAEALQREKDRLEQASRDKSAFMARMSHELRTPLNAVLGFSRLLEDDRDEPPSARQRERLRRIGAAGTRLLALVDDMLELAAVEADDAVPARVPVALDSLLDEALAEIEPLRREQRASLTRENGLPTVLTDAPRLRRGLVLLIEVLMLRGGPGARVHIGSSAPGDGTTTCLNLRDGGVPAPAEPAASLFGPLLGADATAADAGAPADEATALRLSLARALLNALGAEVRVRDHDDGSTELCVRLPLAPDQPAEPALATPAAAPAPLQVLCVEDNPVNLMLVRELLALRPQVQLLTAEDAAGGLESARAHPPDVALLDLQLPDLHGTELMKRLRAEPALAGCHYIALSADAMPDHVSAALAAGFDAYWTKPIEFDRFLAGIDALVAAPRRKRPPG
jgi:PAS domain S-box-containing protein